MPLAGKCRTARAPPAALLAAVFVNLALLFLVVLQVSTLRTRGRPMPHIAQSLNQLICWPSVETLQPLMPFAPAGTRCSSLLRCCELALGSSVQQNLSFS